jgi:hypothetical protein
MDGRRLRRTIASSNSFCLDELCKAVVISRHSGSGNLVEEALTFNLLKSKRRTLERYEARTDKRR